MVAAEVANAFLPCKEAANAANAAMHRALCASLHHLAETVAPDACARDLRFVAETCSSDRELPPEVYGWYYALCFPLLGGDVDGARGAVKKLANRPLGGSPDLKVHAIDHPDIAPMRALFLSRLDLRGEFALAAPTGQVQDVGRRLEDGLSLLRQTIPELYGELSVLVRRIILIATPDTGRPFDGAAVYQLWRLLFLNENRLADRIDLIETLIHEAVHIFLFGNTIETALTLNDPTETHYSVIRREKRPVDGVYHAMIVNARIVWAFSKLQERRDLFSVLERRRMAWTVDRHAEMYEQNKSVIAQYGKLSEIGERISQDAAACMDKILVDRHHALARLATR